ncbi:MarR family winged helix-turn-helix transcriptional regulator [Lentzea sp. NPDC051208]|uniref:MarR family winged helix-turn-helix transcriptional regulator n=1 Tax=Lentzea sp. NPDC051208 TaxID=3154642 RepID=UPI0034493C22
MTDQIALLVADVFEAAGALRRHGERTAQAAGLTQARWQLLSVASDEPVTVPQAARRLGVSRQNVQRVTNDLIASGHLRQLPNPGHRASPLLTLAEEGRRALDDVTSKATAVHRTMFVSLSEKEVRSARAVIRKLLAELRDDEHD